VESCFIIQQKEESRVMEARGGVCRKSGRRVGGGGGEGGKQKIGIE